MAELQNKLPVGWESKLDPKTGKFYYLNHITKTTTWDDPRLINKPRHPSTVEHIPLQDMTNSARNSPKGPVRIQETSLVTEDAEQSFAKISAMFPTVSDTHIRLLLKKYLNREALVISALQVEKHPITTPGPFATPPAARNIIPAVHALQQTPPLSVRFGSRGGSPVPRPGSGCSSSYASEVYRNSPKPHSPKLKLRYMKSLFPKAEETIILDVLNCNDNNIQKTSEALKEMGFDKREIDKNVPKKQESPKPEQPKPEIVKKPESSKYILPETKAKIKSLLGEKYKNVPEQVITFALESVDYDQDRANQILQIMVQEENDKNTVTSPENSETSTSSTATLKLEVKQSQSRHSLKSDLKTEKSDYSLKEVAAFSRVIEENENIQGTYYQSPNLSSTKGANRSIAKGANHELLLEDYIKWQGADSAIRKGPRSFAKGPDPSLRSSRTYKPCGPNKELRKGPQCGLSKGSIFSQFKGMNLGESRGK